MAVVESLTQVAPALTEEQQAALRTREVSVGMSAGAGCGKTFVLTQRFLSHLDPTNPWADDAASRLEQLIAITFTDRAAREMRQRIRSECRRRLLTCSDEYADFWLNLLRSLESARISTIHSFCGSLLRAHAVEAGLDPHFTILEPLQANTILASLIADDLRERLNDQDEDVLDLASLYGLGRLSSFVFGFLEQRQIIPWSEWENVTPQELAQRWEHHFQHHVLPDQISQFAGSLLAQDCLGLLDRYQPEHDLMEERCERVKEILELTISTQPIEALKELLEVARIQGGGGKSVWPSEEAYILVRDCFHKIRERTKNLIEKLSFDPTHSLVTAELGLKLLRIAACIHQTYEQRKADLVCLDFDDLVIRAHQLLAHPQHEELRQRLARNTQLLMIDEFQDTDPIQAELVQFFCGSELANGKLFFVGDHKQSIYRFRGADPNVFSDLRSKLPPEACLSLGLNFRSQPAILHFVNYLFSQPLSAPEDYQPLRAFHPQVNPGPCIEFLWAHDENESEERPTTETLRRCEANWIARRIRQMIDTRELLVRDTEQEQPLRPVEPGDIAILFQALSDLQYYENALREYDLPYYLVGGHAFYAQQEVFDLLNLLRAIAKPTDSISLVGALRSPFFGIADETLFWLKQSADSLHQALLSEDMPQELDRQQQQRWRFAQRTLRALREKKDRLPIASLLREIMDRTSYDAGLLADFLGDRKYGNLQKLMEMARSFDRSGLFTLDDYITQLSEFVAKQPKEPPAATEPEDSNVVRLMSIHQAKGLEFPVVVVPDLQRKRQNSSDPVAFSPTLGPLVQPPTDDEAQKRSCGLALYRLEEQVAADAEMDRLFYVATTRAADYLVLSSGVDNLDKPQGSWMKLLAEHFDLPTGTPIQAEVDSQLAQQLGQQYASPRVRVTAECPVLEQEVQARQRGPSLSKIIEQVEQDPAQQTPRFVPNLEPQVFAEQQYLLDRATGTLELQEVASLDPLEEAFHSSFGLADPQAQQRRLDSLIYAVWRLWDWQQPEQLAGLVREQTSKYHLPSMEPLNAERVLGLFERFAASERFAQLATATQIFRGMEYLFPANHPGQGQVTLQGTIDCLYQTPEGWVLLQFQIRPEGEGTSPLTLSLRLAEQAARAWTADAGLTARIYDLWSGEEFAPSPQNSLDRLLPRALESANAKYLKTSPQQTKPAAKQRSLWEG